MGQSLSLGAGRLPMIRQLRSSTIKYGAVTAANLQHQLAYMWDAVGRALFILLIMFVFAHLWSAVYETQNSAVIAGLTLSNTIWYFLMAEVMELGRTRIDARITEEVKDGSVAYTLSKPYNYLLFHFFNGLGETLVKMGLVFVLGAPIALYYGGMPGFNWEHLPFVLITMLLAICLDFLVAGMIGLLAFVTEDTSSFRLIYQKLVFILGGLMIPLDFLPGWLQRIARLLPFNLTTYGPAKLFVLFSWAQFNQVLMLQLLWLLILGVILIWQYRWATRRLVVNGG